MNKDSLSKQNKLVLVDMVLTLYGKLQDAQATIAIYESAPPAAADPPVMMAPPPPPPPAPVALPALPPAYPDLSVEVRGLTEEKTALTAKVAALEVAVAAAKAAAAAAEAKADAAVEEVETLQERLSNLHSQRLATKDGRIADLEKYLDSKEAELSQERIRFRTQLEDAKREHDQETERLRAKISNLHSEKLATRDTRIADLESDLARMEEELSQERTRGRTQLGNAKREHEDDHKRLTEEIGALHKRLKDADALMKELQARYNRLCEEGIAILDRCHSYRLKSNAQHDLLADWREFVDGVYHKMDAALKQKFASLAERSVDVVTKEFQPNKSNTAYQKFLRTFAPTDVSGLGLPSK